MITLTLFTLGRSLRWDLWSHKQSVRSAAIDRQIRLRCGQRMTVAVIGDPVGEHIWNLPQPAITRRYIQV